MKKFFDVLIYNKKLYQSGTMRDSYKKTVCIKAFFLLSQICPIPVPDVLPIRDFLHENLHLLTLDSLVLCCKVQRL